MLNSAQVYLTVLGCSYSAETASLAKDRYTSCTGTINLLKPSRNGHETFDQCPSVSQFEGVSLICC